ncbi:hypothetical protein ACFW81_02655 [Streptomyces angustmyceticus]|uniref:hypothetical protein n=1 Tax=Streptomyces angustmyceticus TaxID=285578 RepID=UPI0036B69CF3
MNTTQAQLAAAREKGLRIVRLKATGEEGWVTQELNYGFTLRVRIAGATGSQAVRRVKVDDVE